MFLRPFRLDAFLRSVAGSQPFADYCRERSILLSPPRPRSAGFVARWLEALGQLAPHAQTQVELELATVSEMSGRSATAHLVEAADGLTLPPVTVPGGSPLALWFLLHHPGHFHAIFLEHQMVEVDCWRTARAARGVTVADLSAAAGALAEDLGTYFASCEGTGRFWSAESFVAGETLCFVVRVADRLAFIESFTNAGRPIRQPVRPSRRILFAYYPDDGTVLVQSHLRSRGRTAELLDRFGRSVLGSTVELAAAAFNLEVLKRPFHPLPDAQDMHGVRVKALHLRYPERHGRRVVKLETLADDSPDAIESLLASHVAAELLPDLHVCHAELQVGLLIDGRSKRFPIRLWPDRCNLSQTVLGSRFRACLRRWRLYVG